MTTDTDQKEENPKIVHKSIVRENFPLSLLILIPPTFFGVLGAFSSGPRYGLEVFGGFLAFLVVIDLWYASFGSMSKEARDEFEDALAYFFGRFFWLALVVFILYAVVRK